jgi:hypothetical protein
MPLLGVRLGPPASRRILQLAVAGAFGTVLDAVRDAL